MKTQVNVSLSEELSERLRRTAVGRGKPPEELVRELIQGHLDGAESRTSADGPSERLQSRSRRAQGSPGLEEITLPLDRAPDPPPRPSPSLGWRRGTP